MPDSATCIIAATVAPPREREPSSRPAPRRIGRYVLTSTLGTGGMATVSLAKLAGDAGFSRPVAVKQLLEEHVGDRNLVESLLDEARLVSLIRHPNVVQVLDVVADDAPLVVMEYVFGDSLAGLLARAEARREAVPPPVAAAIAIGMLEGLHAAHEATDAGGAPISLVHRDVSPQNVLVGADGTARVADFGIAKALGRAQATTEHGVAKGKVMYMAPEQFGGAPVDRRTDVFAAGIVLWEMLTGKPFFVDAPAMFRFHVGLESVQPPSALVAAAAPLDAIVMRAVSPSPAERFASAREMAVAIERALAPANARRVGHWVRRLAADKLEQKEADLRELAALDVDPAPRTLGSSAAQPTPAPSGEVRAAVPRSSAPSSPSLAPVAPASMRAAPAPRAGVLYTVLTILVALVIALAGWRIAARRQAAIAARTAPPTPTPTEVRSASTPFAAASPTAAAPDPAFAASPTAAAPDPAFAASPTAARDPAFATSAAAQPTTAGVPAPSLVTPPAKRPAKRAARPSAPARSAASSKTDPLDMESRK